MAFSLAIFFCWRLKKIFQNIKLKLLLLQVSNFLSINFLQTIQSLCKRAWKMNSKGLNSFTMKVMRFVATKPEMVQKASFRKILAHFLLKHLKRNWIAFLKFRSFCDQLMLVNVPHFFPPFHTNCHFYLFFTLGFCVFTFYAHAIFSIYFLFPFFPLSFKALIIWPSSDFSWQVWSKLLFFWTSFFFLKNIFNWLLCLNLFLLNFT